ncbi:MAG: outer membrane beta-barrel protein [Chlorobium sp.]
MKKKLFLPLLIAGMWATPALADPYVSVSAGLGILNNSDVTVSGTTYKDAAEYKSAVPFGAAVGVKLDEYRVEAAVGYQSYTMDKRGLVSVSGADVSGLSFMANGYRDFPLKNSGIIPYLTAGLGIAKVKGADTSSAVFSLDQSKFAWQAGAGLGIKASDNVIVDLGYRYYKISTATGISPDNSGTGETFEISNLGGSQFLAGVRYGF